MTRRRTTATAARSLGLTTALTTALTLALAAATPALAQDRARPGQQADHGVRFATFNVSLNRATEGELEQDLADGTDEQARNVAETIQRVNPDVLLVNEFDYSPQAADLFRAHYLEVGQRGIPLGNDLGGVGIRTGVALERLVLTPPAFGLLGIEPIPGRRQLGHSVPNLPVRLRPALACQRAPPLRFLRSSRARSGSPSADPEDPPRVTSRCPYSVETGHQLLAVPVHFTVLHTFLRHSLLDPLAIPPS